jgi:cell cycle related kinase
MDQYELMGKIGEGTFGEVFKAKHVQCGRMVALKKVRIRNVHDGIPKNLLREIKALEMLEHDNIVHMYESFPCGSSIVLSCEYMVSDLHQVMRCLSEEGRAFPEWAVKTIMKMTLEGVAAVHEARLIHRDLKPANLLFSPSGVLKLGDFGLARVHEKDGQVYSHEVATRWYRPPELLYGARKYGFSVDLWAVGCIFGELLNHSPIFPGENDIDQIYRIVRSLGSLNEKSWPGAVELPDYNKISFPDMDAVPLDKLLPDAPRAAVDLLRKFLVYRPEGRIAAREALQDKYFFTDPLPMHPSSLWDFIFLPMQKKRKKLQLQQHKEAPPQSTVNGIGGNMNLSSSNSSSSTFSPDSSNNNNSSKSNHGIHKFDLLTRMSVDDILPFQDKY